MWRRAFDLLRRRRLDADLDAELAYHQQSLETEYVARGLTSEQARLEARRAMGSLSQVREAYRDQHGIPPLETAWRNVWLAVRALRRAPGLTATAVVTLALGIGANTAVFSTIDAIVLRPLPYRDGDRLVRLYEVRPTGEFFAALPRVDDWNRLATTFDGISAYSVSDGSDNTRALPERAQYSSVAPRFFEILGVAPRLGRGFTAEEHRFGTPTPVLLSNRFWRDSWGADPGAVGKTIRWKDVGGELSFTVAGVMDDSFLFVSRGVTAWSPAKVDAPWFRNRGPQMAFWNAVGRLKPGVTLEQARADIARVQTQLAARFPTTDRDLEVRLEPLKDRVIGDVRPSLWLLFGAVSLLLVIACTNIAALLIARGAQRAQEVSVRFALGATRRAVAAQMLTEAAVLAVAGSAAGIVVALAGTAAIRRLAPNLPRLDEVRLDARLLLYTVVATTMVALLCGLLPAIRSTRHEASARPDGGRVTRRQRLQWLLVGVQVALSVTLLAGAGLLLRSFDALSRIDTGFDGSRVLAFQVYAAWGAERPEQLLPRIDRTLDGLRTMPGVESVATAWALPGIPSTTPQPAAEFAIEGQAAASVRPTARFRPVSPGYFSTVRIAMVAGTLCRRPEDQATRLAGVEAMVNRSFADRYFSGASPLGQRLTRNGFRSRVVGIVDDVRELGVDRPATPVVYECDTASSQMPWYLVRTRGEPQAFATAVRVKMKELEPLRAVFQIASLDSHIGDAFTQTRLRTVLLALFALTALALACLGVYGTLSYVVGLRRREVGVRLALGAARASVVQHFVGIGLRVSALACLVGLALAAWSTRLLQGMLFGVTAADPLTYSGVVALVLTVAVLAALVPAARAAMAEPMRVLREE